MIGRRSFMKSGMLFALPGTGMCGLLQDALNSRTDSYRDFDSNIVPDLQKYGTTPALSEEVKRAEELLNKVPRPASPFEVMHYLESLPDRNVEGEAYNGGWKDRWNPLIVRFFTQTHTQPAGDTTAWCAASLNWVLAASGASGTGSASSGSFRSSGGVTTNPKFGDVVVFRSTEARQAQVGHGHVGLFLDSLEDSILVLGGNQKNDFGHHAICRKWIKKSGTQLTFDSYHSIDAFSKSR